MKFNSKKILGIALLLVAVGIVVFGIGYAIAGQNSTKAATESQDYALSDISRIRIDADSPRIVILPVSGDRVNTVWNTGNDVVYQASLTDGELTIRYDIDTNWMRSILSLPLNENDFVLKIELPEDYAGEIAVSTESGSVTVQGPYTLQDISLQTASGSIDVSDIDSRQAVDIGSASGSIQADSISAATDINVQNVSGMIRLQTVSAHSGIACQTTSGGIEAAGLEAGLTITAKSMSGKVELSQATCNAAVVLESASGSVKLTEVDCQTITADLTSGSITLQQLAADEITLRCVSGSISGTVCGVQEEYSIIVNTVSGSSNLRSAVSDTGKTLSLDTTSGSISVKFTGSDGD